MSTLKLNALQIGQSATTTNNFTLYQPTTPDGTLRIGNGNNGSVTDILSINSNNNLGIGTITPTTKLDVVGVSQAYGHRVQGATSITGAGMWGLDSTLAFNTSSIERMRIDSSGRITTPFQPICQVTRNNGGETLAANTSYGLGSQFTVNRGGFYTGGTVGGGGVVVHVPISGMYRVTLNVYKQGGVSGRRLEVRSSAGTIICFTEITATADGTYSSSGCINMTASQYLYLNVYGLAFQCYTAPMHTDVTIEFLG